MASTQPELHLASLRQMSARSELLGQPDTQTTIRSTPVDHSWSRCLHGIVVIHRLRVEAIDETSDDDATVFEAEVAYEAVYQSSEPLDGAVVERFVERHSVQMVTPHLEAAISDLATRSGLRI